MVVATSKKALSRLKIEKASSARQRAESTLSATEEDADASKEQKLPELSKQSYFFTLVDVSQQSHKSNAKSDKSSKKWRPRVHDEVEFSVCTNVSTGKVRATNVVLVKSSVVVQRGVVETLGLPRCGLCALSLAVPREVCTARLQTLSTSLTSRDTACRDGTLRFDFRRLATRAILNLWKVTSWNMSCPPTGSRKSQKLRT